MRLQPYAKRARKPSAFAPAVGVQQPGSSSSTGALSSTSAVPSSSSPSSLDTSRASDVMASPFKSALVHLLSGGLAAGLVRASLQPLDTCKTRLQAAHYSSSATVTSSLRTVLFAGGVRGLYKGVVPGVAGIVPAAAVYMLTFQMLKGRLGVRFPRRRNDIVVVAAAAVADVAASLVRVPCEVLKQRLQVGLYRHVAHALQAVVASPVVGVPRLYAGLPAQLARDVPYTAAEFLIYENLKAAVFRRRAARHATVNAGYTTRGRQVEHLRLQETKLNRSTGLAIGAVAGAFAAVISNPADVVKTRLMTQVQIASNTVVSSPVSTSASAITGIAARSMAYRGVRDAFVRIAKEEGVATFAKGIAPRMAAKALQSALFFAAYEGLRWTISGAFQVDHSKVAKPSH